MREKIKAISFTVVCGLVVVGGIFAVDILKNESTPQEVIGVVIGGGFGVVVATVLLADRFGYIERWKPNSRASSALVSRTPADTEERVRKDAWVRISLEGESRNIP